MNKNKLFTFFFLLCALSALALFFFIGCDNSPMNGILPDREEKGGDGNITLKLIVNNAETGDKVSFSNVGSLMEISVTEGHNILIYYNLETVKLTDELVLSFGPSTKTVIIEVPGSSFRSYTVRSGDAVNGVIAIIADFIHTDKTPLNPPDNVYFDKDGVITFTPGANNITAGCTYTYTLYRDDLPISIDQPFTPNVNNPNIVTEMLSCDGFYTVKVKANTPNPSFTSASIESEHSEVVSVFAVNINISGASSAETVEVTVNGTTSNYTNTVVYLYYFSGTNITLTAAPGAGRAAVWTGIPGSDDTRVINNIWTNYFITVTFTTPVITINPPSAVTYSNNYKDRNALTPLSGEHTATFTVAVSGFVYDIDAYNATLDITTVPGLTVSGHNTIGNAAGGTKLFTLHATYNGTQDLISAVNSAVITIKNNLNNMPSGYTLQSTGDKTITINIIDGLHPDRPIPVTNNNIMNFNAYARTTAGLSNKFYIQTEDITLTQNWSTISGTFNSVYDGSGYVITNLVNIGNGLFSTIGENGTVKNLGVKGSITNSIVGGYTGSIVGLNRGMISNCYSDVTIVSNTNHTGGIAGQNNGTIEKCYNIGNITNTATVESSVSGIAGANHSGGLIVNCYNTGNITGARAYSGGIVGWNDWVGNGRNSIVKNCYNTGIITGPDIVGGIGGYSLRDTNNVIQDSVSLGSKVTSNTIPYRVVGRNLGARSLNNKARRDMIINRAGTELNVTSADADSLDGADVELGDPLSDVFSGWDTTVWNIPNGNLFVGGQLPTLRNMPAGAQNPTLPY